MHLTVVFGFIFVWWCETATCNGPIVYHLEDRWMKVEYWWDDNWQVKNLSNWRQKIKKKTLSIAALFATNSTIAAVEMKLCLCGENLVAKPPKNCAVLQCLNPWVRSEIHFIFWGDQLILVWAQNIPVVCRPSWVVHGCRNFGNPASDSREFAFDSSL